MIARPAVAPAVMRSAAVGAVRWGWFHLASVGWILPMLHDPDGHEIRFYTLAHHTDLDPDAVTTIHDPRENAERRARDHDTATAP